MMENQIIVTADGDLLWYDPKEHTYQHVQIAEQDQPTCQSESENLAACLPADTNNNNVNDLEGTHSQNVWNKSETLLFITLCMKYKDKIYDNKVTKKAVFTLISKEMQQHNYNFTWEQCYGRMKTLVSKYKSIRDHNSTSGNAHKTWEFYDHLYDFMGDRANVVPKASCSSLHFSERQTSEAKEKPEESSSTATPGSSNPKKRKIKPSPRTEMTKWLEKYSNETKEQETARNEMMERHHKDNLDIMKSLLESLKNNQ